MDIYSADEGASVWMRLFPEKFVQKDSQKCRNGKETSQKREAERAERVLRAYR
jgi:hypothetical protein